jgi:hypothetical protein
MPKKASANASNQKEGARPIISRITGYINAAIILIERLPNLFISQPAMGIAIREPTGLLNSKAPNSPSLNPNFSLISGILEAQLEKHKPLKKNKEFTAILLFRFVCILLKNAATIVYIYPVQGTTDFCWPKGKS